MTQKRAPRLFRVHLSSFLVSCRHPVVERVAESPLTLLRGCSSLGVYVIPIACSQVV